MIKKLYYVSEMLEVVNTILRQYIVYKLLQTMLLLPKYQLLLCLQISTSKATEKNISFYEN